MNQNIPLLAEASGRRKYNVMLMCVAGLGGLLYGVDIGIIGGALPYLEATSGLDAGQLSVIVAAVLLGSVISTVFAGTACGLAGRKPVMALSGLIFVVSIPLIALSHGYAPLFLGRLLQGVSGGFIGVVVPLYLAECLPSSNRGKGTGVFQWLLTFGIVAAALIGIYYSYRVQDVTSSADAATVFHVKDQAWRHIFWISLPPGILFAVGSLFVGESPRWLFRKGKRQLAFASLLRSREHTQAEREFAEMQTTSLDDAVTQTNNGTLLRRKYVVPFLLACVVLFCNTATGVNSIIGYNTSILLHSGLSDLAAHWGYVLFTAVNFLMTIVGLSCVDRIGRRFLLILGSTGLMVSLIVVGALFWQTERSDIECRESVQSLVEPQQELTLHFDPVSARRLLTASGTNDLRSLEDHASLVVIYSYGGFAGETRFVRSDDPSAASISITRQRSIPNNVVEAFFRNPFADLESAKTAPLMIQRARIGRIPSTRNGILVASALFLFIAFFAVGPGVCVWLALSELMPTRIRSVGMSIALVINQLVSTTLAVLFLPVVSKYGYSTIFFLFAGFTVLYVFTSTLLMPETKGKTLEEIEKYFESGQRQRTDSSA